MNYKLVCYYKTELKRQSKEWKNRLSGKKNKLLGAVVYKKGDADSLWNI